MPARPVRGYCAATRISTAAFWDVANRVMSATLYLLAGHELPVAVQELGRWPVWHVALVAAGLLGVVVLVQAADEAKPGAILGAAKSPGF